MAKYTIELRKICDIYTRPVVEQWFKSYNIEDYLLPDQIAQLAKFNVFSKDRLAKQIVDHFYMREIGFETPALFKHYAQITMEEIMQEKLPLFYTLALDYDPLINVDYTETFERTANHQDEITGKNDNTTTLEETGSSTTNSDTTNDTNTSSSGTNKNTSSGTSKVVGNSNSNASNSAEGLNIINDTPQGKITKQNLANGAYASSVNQSDTSSTSEQTTDTTNTTTNNSTSNDETTSSSESNNISNTQSTNTTKQNNTSNSNSTNSQNSNQNTTENYTRNFKGNQGIMATYPKMIQQFRNNIISINKDIMNELQTLFMGLY